MSTQEDFTDGNSSAGEDFDIVDTATIEALEKSGQSEDGHSENSLLESSATAESDESPPFSRRAVLEEAREEVASNGGGGEWDWREVGDETLAQLCVFTCPDKPVQLMDANRSMTSMPLNLTLRPSQEIVKSIGVYSTDFIPRGARFGPIVGEMLPVNEDNGTLCPTEAMTAGNVRALAQAPPSPILWKAFTSPGARLVGLIDSSDDSKSNWMKYVKRATTSDSQNLLAFQIDQDIYFCSIKPIAPNTELLFWYSRDYAIRLGVPANCGTLKPSSIVLYAPTSDPWKEQEKTSNISPLEALDISANKEPMVVRKVPVEKHWHEDTSEEHGLAELTPMAHSDDSTSSHSSSVSPPSIPEIAHQRPNVIQYPVPNVHRPVPLRLPSLPSLTPTSAMTLFDEYFRRSQNHVNQNLLSVSELWNVPTAHIAPTDKARNELDDDNEEEFADTNEPLSELHIATKQKVLAYLDFTTGRVIVKLDFDRCYAMSSWFMAYVNNSSALSYNRRLLTGEHELIAGSSFNYIGGDELKRASSNGFNRWGLAFGVFTTDGRATFWLSNQPTIYSRYFGDVIGGWNVLVNAEHLALDGCGLLNQ